MRPHRSGLLCALAILLVGAGCGHSGVSGAGSEPAGGPRRLLLTSDLKGGARPELLATRSLAFGPDTAVHVVRAGAAELQPVAGPSEQDPEGEWQMMLGPDSQQSIELLVPFEPRAYQRVALEVTVRGPQSIQAVAMREDGRGHASERVHVVPEAGRQAVVLDLPQLRIEAEPSRGLVLHFTGRGRTYLSLHRVDWLAQPVAGWLPRAGDEPRHLMLGGESRLAIGLTGEERLSTRFDVHRGDLLSFGYGVPPRMGLTGDPARLELRLSGGGREFRSSYPLTTLGEESAWQDVQIELRSWAGREVELELSLAGPAGHEGICALSVLRVRDPRARAPLVFLLTSDTHRADHVGAAGLGIDVHTPELDALAAGGVWFGNCFSSTNVTNPSHVTLMTGVHVRDHGVVSNTMGLGEQGSTLAEAFRRSGWATIAAVSNTSLGPRWGGLEQGFERFAVPLQNPGDAREAVDRILEWWPAAEGLPLFCWLHVFDAHWPYEPPDPTLVERYYPAGKDPFDASLPPLEGVTDRQLPPGLRGLRDLDWPLALYRAEITYLDRELGRILRQPRFKDAIIACTADHGELLGTQGRYFDHADLYPGNLHVPLILRWPGAPAGARVAAPVEQAWVGRTLLDLAGLEGLDFPGQDLRAFLTQDQPPPRPRFALAANRLTASITVWPWHLTLHLVEHTVVRGIEPNRFHSVRLFELERDPHCEHDLVAAGEELERARRLRELLVAWCNAGAELDWVGTHMQSAEVVAELARLGYAEDSPAPASRTLIDADCGCEWCLRFR